MKRVCVLALLAGVGCSEKGSVAQDQKATAALANKDEQCPGGTVKGCFDAAVEAERKGEVARPVELHSRVCDAGVARACTLLATLGWQGRGADRSSAPAFVRQQPTAPNHRQVGRTCGPYRNALFEAALRPGKDF